MKIQNTEYEDFRQIIRFLCEDCYTDSSDTEKLFIGGSLESEGRLLCSYVDPRAHHVIGSENLKRDEKKGLDCNFVSSNI